MSKEKLTQEQQARIYCIKHGHADYITEFWGEIYCGRCGDKIGDCLTGVFPVDKVANPVCKEEPCKVCDPIVKKLNKMDKLIFRRLKKGKSHEEAIKGVVFA